MKTNIRIGVEKTGRSGLTAVEFDRTVSLRTDMRVSVVGTTTVGVVTSISGDDVTVVSDTGKTFVEKPKFLRSVVRGAPKNQHQW